MSPTCILPIFNKSIIFEWILIPILFIGVNSNVLSQVDDHRHFFWGISYWYLGVSVNNMPLSPRSAPIHPDDTYADPANAGPIDSLFYSKAGSFNFNVGFQYPIGKYIRLTASLDWLLSRRGSKHLRNYTNAVGTEKRGTGAALTYTSMAIRGAFPSTNIGIIDFLSNVSPKAGLETPIRLGGCEITPGINAGYFRLVGENGWDRYDALEQHRQYLLAHVFPISIQINWLFNGIGITTGISNYLLQYSKNGADSAISFRWGGRKGLGFYVALKATIDNEN